MGNYIQKSKKRDHFILKVASGIVVGILLFGIVIIGFFTAVEYRPKEIEEVTVNNNQILKVKLNQEYNVLTFNIGYASLGSHEDFVMDGGTRGIPDSIGDVEYYLDGIKNILLENPSDIYLLQEVDLFSRRSYRIDQPTELAETLGIAFSSSFGHNYKAVFVPFPFSVTDYMGRVESGMLSFMKFNSNNAERHQFSSEFSWPVRTVNLKRGMVVNYLPIEGSDKLLVVVNLHLSAYDSEGDMREKEMQDLKNFLITEKEKGNYVLVGGDFNQTFPGVTKESKENKWFTPYKIEDDYLPERYKFAIDPEVWTSRLLNQPYNIDDVENTYHFIIDGFIVSDNIEIIEVSGLDLGFEYSDHNPVKLKFKLI